MKILAIETSCDETAVALLEASQTDSGTVFHILGNALLSQIDIHKEYGGVYPAIAKREHAKNLVPLLGNALEQASLLKEGDSLSHKEELSQILEREPGLTDALTTFLSQTARPDIDALAVTAGPGLEPALWVGVNFAKALSLVWNLPIVSVNHMEGHIYAALSSFADDSTHTITVPEFRTPLLSLLISGGHTELVLSNEPGVYELLGATRDDAVGEAFDKVARMLGLPYPGGPEVSKLAEQARSSGRTNPVTLPRPMIHDPHLDFSFSGLKTAVLYMVKDKELSDEDRENIAWAFEDAAADVLYSKTAQALEVSDANTLALGGGVSANTHIKRVFAQRIATDFLHVHLAIPVPALTTDNALMIGLAGFYHAVKEDFIDSETLKADGNRKLAPTL
jgi:N6-L-threonylcarbamoyladenine synthase